MSILDDYRAREAAMCSFGNEQHWVLSTTRNGQKLWDGPFSSQEAAEGFQQRLLAPASVIICGRVVAGLTVHPSTEDQADVAPSPT
jgi:hypothetical protein